MPASTKSQQSPRFRRKNQQAGKLVDRITPKSGSLLLRLAESYTESDALRPSTWTNSQQRLRTERDEARQRHHHQTMQKELVPGSTKVSGREGKLSCWPPRTSRPRLSRTTSSPRESVTSSGSRTSRTRSRKTKMDLEASRRQSAATSAKELEASRREVEALKKPVRRKHPERKPKPSRKRPKPSRGSWKRLEMEGGRSPEGQGGRIAKGG